MFSNFERRIAVKLPLPPGMPNGVLLVCPNCAAVFGVDEQRAMISKGSPLSIGNFDLKDLKPFKPEKQA